MKKNIKAVLACTAALVIAGGGYAVLMLTGANEDSGNSSTSSIAENSISVPTELFSFEKTDIISVSAENAGGGFEALPVGKSGFVTAMYIVLVPILGIFLHKGIHIPEQF